MAKKRTAITDLNHDNWDEEEKHEESGIFKTAPKEELQKREIRTARRRKVAGQDSANSQANTGVFGAFAGFNKSAPSSFDFLSKLTNGAGGYDVNGSPSQKDCSVGNLGISPIASSTAIIGNNPSSEGTKSSLFTGASNTAMKSVATSQEASTATASSKAPTVFSIPPSTTSATSIFGTLATLTTTGLPFSNPPKPSELTSSEVQKSDTHTSKSESVFGNVGSVLTPFKLPKGVVTSTFNMGSNGSNSESPAKRTSSDEKGTSNPTSHATSQYYSKLKGLNESVSDWIKKHVNENPLCILTPIFKDYEKYLKELEEEKKANESKMNAACDSKKSTSNNPIFSSSSTPTSPTAPSSKTSAFSLNTSAATSALLSSSTKSVSTTSTKMLASVPLSFGISSANTINTSSTSSTPAPFSFGISSGNVAATSTQAPFSFGIGSSSNTSSTNSNSVQPPFSFGIGNTFSFNANVQRPPENVEKKEYADEEDELPKEEFTPIEEENSVFDKKCKIFFKKDGNYVDKGIGTLYIKKIDTGSKHQLIVRANTSLGTLLINFILNESLPMQRMGKNNVMVVCIPTPDAKPPPVAVLIRVKTSEEADGLLETLNKYKK